MHYAEIAQEIIDKVYRTGVGATPAATVAANISEEPRIERVSTGVYRLRTSSPAPQSKILDQGDASDEDANLDAVADVEPTEQMGLVSPLACSGGAAKSIGRYGGQNC